jgi:outer membrane protein TolC
VLYEARTYERFRRTFAFDVTARFFFILTLRDALQNERENEKSVRSLRERNEAFAEAGLLNDIEVDQARQDELRARNRVIQVERDLATALDDFKLFLGLPIQVDLPLEVEGYLTPERWAFLELEPSPQAVVSLALARRLDHLNIVERVDDAERRVVVARDALRAGLDLEVGAAAASPLGEPGKISLDDTAWTVGLEADLPFDRLPERNTYRASLISLDQSRRNVETSADNITAEVREEFLFLRAARESYEIQKNAVTLAARRVESTELQLEAGRADTRDVLESQNSLLEARNALTAALSDFILSGLALYRDMELIRIGPEGFSVETDPLLPGHEPPPTDAAGPAADPAGPPADPSGPAEEGGSP